MPNPAWIPHLLIAVNWYFNIPYTQKSVTVAYDVNIVHIGTLLEVKQPCFVLPHF